MHCSARPAILPKLLLSCDPISGSGRRKGSSRWPSRESPRTRSPLREWGQVEGLGLNLTGPNPKLAIRAFSQPIDASTRRLSGRLPSLPAGKGISPIRASDAAQRPDRPKILQVSLQNNGPLNGPHFNGPERPRIRLVKFFQARTYNCFFVIRFLIHFVIRFEIFCVIRFGCIWERIGENLGPEFLVLDTWSFVNKPGSKSLDWPALGSQKSTKRNSIEGSGFMTKWLSIWKVLSSKQA